MFWMMSRVSGSIMIGPRGLSGFFHFLKNSIASSAVNLPLVALTRSKIAVAPSHASTDRKSGIELSPYSLCQAATKASLAGRGIGAGGDDAERGIAHVGQRLVRQEVLRRGDVDPRFAHAKIPDRLDQRRRLRVGRHEEERDVGLGILDALDERDEVGVLRRHADGADDLTAAVGETLGKGHL